MNILSIDFDYFQNVSADVMRYYYPDGVDLPPELTAMVWSTHYANPETEKKLQEVTIREDLIEKVKQSIEKNCDEGVAVLIASSHVTIYKYIQELIKCRKPNYVSIVNLDMHHDYSNGNKEIDCGNWVEHAIQDFPNCKVQWIPNPISDELYGDKKINLPRLEIDDLNDIKFDVIFMCRSDTWFPPHLDSAFEDFFLFLVNKFVNNWVEVSVQKPRDLDKYIKEVKDLFIKKK